MKENDSKLAMPSNSSAESRKTPHARRSEMLNKEERKRDIHYTKKQNKSQESRYISL